MKPFIPIIVILLLMSTSFVGLSDSLGGIEQSSISSLDDGITLYVGGSGPGNYSTIQEAIDDSSDGDTVFVYDDSSPYNESVYVYKSINLIGEDKNTTVIDGNNSGKVVKITIDWVNFSNFTIQNCGHYWEKAEINIYSNKNAIFNNKIKSNLWYGIEINNYYNNTITGNSISNHGIAIKLDNSHYNTITGNSLLNSTEGIILENSHYNTITGNSILNNHIGIYLDDSNNTYISGNIISNNKDGLRLCDSGNNIIIGNTISNSEDGICSYYFSNNIISGNNIFGNLDNGIYLLHSNNNKIIGNNISLNNDTGIFVNYNSNTISITSNIISNNSDGIILLKSKDHNIIDNKIYSNMNDGILIWETINSTIIGNKINSNWYGIRFKYYSKNNIIYHNNFIDNTQNVIDDRLNNTWDDGKYGNYWSDYKERYPDAKKKWCKGIWNTPYEIKGGDNKDNCPLINQWPKSVIKSKSIYKPFNYNFPVLNWLFDKFSNAFPIKIYMLIPENWQ